MNLFSTVRSLRTTTQRTRREEDIGAHCVVQNSLQRWCSWRIFKDTVVIHFTAVNTSLWCSYLWLALYSSGWEMQCHQNLFKSFQTIARIMKCGHGWYLDVVHGYRGPAEVSRWFSCSGRRGSNTSSSDHPTASACFTCTQQTHSSLHRDHFNTHPDNTNPFPLLFFHSCCSCLGYLSSKQTI